jgi:hypothetical protein
MTSIATRRLATPARAEPLRFGLTAPVGLLVVALAVNFYALSWGLPNGNETWANDAIAPGAPLSIVYRLLISDPWNSGWFWFKYPLAHVFVLAAVYAPYIAWLVGTGGLSHPTADYPHGFADPETALATLALLGRSVSALMGAGCALLAYGCLVRSFGRRSALAGGFAVALCYPIVFYSHTTNVEVPYIFWMMVALLGAVRLVEGANERLWWILMGAGAAMSVATKELGAGFFLGIPLVVLAAQRARKIPWSRIVTGGAIAAVTCVVVMTVANDVALNPTGFFRRLGFLTHRLSPEVALQYAPYYFPIDLGGTKGLAGEVVQLGAVGKRLVQSLGTPTAVLAIAGLFLAARRRAWWTALAGISCLTFYFFGARAMLSLSMRYVLPITVVAAMISGVAIGTLLETERFRLAARAAACAALVWIAVYGLEVDRMLAYDARYSAESWLATHARAGEVVEVYQQPTYLPRFPSFLRVDSVAFEQRTIEGLAERRPDWIVLSSAGLSGVSVAYRKDWLGEESDSEEWMPSQIAPGGTVMNYKRRGNVEFLAALTQERLGYRRIASFFVEPWINRTLIQSLDPEVTIYARENEPHAGERRTLVPGGSADAPHAALASLTSPH